MNKPASGKRRQANGKCTACLHVSRTEIDRDIAAGIPYTVIAERYEGVSADAVRRHRINHLSDERRAMFNAGPIRLAELANRAAEEGMSLLDKLQITQSALMQAFLAAHEAGDRHGEAILATRLLSCIKLTGQLTGELSRTASNVTNNTLIMSSPLMVDLQQMLVTRLRAYPEALREVIAGLEELSAKAMQGATPAVPKPALLTDKPPMESADD